MKKNRKLIFETIDLFFLQFQKVSDSLISHLESISYVLEIKKGDCILKVGEQCSKIYLIKKGILRSFVKIGKKEITNWITCENELVTSIQSSFSQTPSLYNIQALENTTLIVFDNYKLNQTYNKYPELNEVVRKILQLYYSQSDERALIARLPHAKDKLEYLFSSKNKFIYRIPLKFTASFLGIRMETLSRIRRLIK